MSDVDLPQGGSSIAVDELVLRLKGKAYASQRIQIYLPNKDRVGQVIPNIKIWVDQAIQIFKVVNRGATALKDLQGAWMDPDDPTISVDEETTIVYSFISNPAAFRNGIDRIRAFVRKFGNDTNQKEVLIEFDGNAIWIDDFSSP